MSDNEWMIEEYKALRAEILANKDYQKNLLVFGTAVLAAAFGFIFRDQALQDYRGLLLLLTQVLAVSFWHAFQRLDLSTEEIGTYIFCYLETSSALNWELFLRVRMEITSNNGSREAAQGAVAMIGDRKRKPKREDLTKQTNKSLSRRSVESITQMPFVIFSFVCFLLVLRERFSPTMTSELFSSTMVTSDLNVACSLLSGAMLLFMAIAFLYDEVYLKKTTRIIDGTNARLSVSLSYREGSEGFYVPAHLRKRYGEAQQPKEAG